MDYIIYFVITIGILVFVHEFGHFAAAKLSKMRVDVFAIGFGKRLFGYNKISGFTFGDLPKDFDTEGNTDYRLSLLPLGGYVKIAGMVDESFDTDFTNTEPKPYEFRARPTYQKLFVITAGVMMNLTLTLIIFAGINFFQGKQILETTTVGKVAQESVAAEAGFQTGDKILDINGTPVDNWEQVLNTMFIDNIGKDVEVSVERNGDKTDFTVPQKIIAENSSQSIFLPFGDTRPYIGSVIEGSPAEDAGIQAGDIFLNLNGKDIFYTKDAIEIISSNNETPLPLTILRGEDTVRTTVTPSMDGLIGVSLSDYYMGPIKYKSYGFIESVTQSIANIGQYTVLTFTMLKSVISGNTPFNQSFGGPIKIAQFAAKSADTGIISFLSFLALLSLSLAIINILPFPVLDGGHMVIIIIEALIKRELPIKVKVAIQNTGFIILLLLMVFIIYNDIISL